MKPLRKPLLFLLSVTTALAAPVLFPDAFPPLYETHIRARQQGITEPVTFQTVTTTPTQVGTIIQTCDVSLTPVTGSDGAQLVREDKKCTYVVVPPGESAPPSADSGSPAPDQNATPTPTDGEVTTTAPPDGGTTTAPGAGDSPTSTPIISSTSTGADSAPSPPPPPISVIGPGTVPLSSSQVVAPTASPTPASTSASATAPASSPPATTIPVTLTSTLPDGSVTTFTTTPTAAQAQESAQKEEVPGRKLEVLPIGLGVFAGISVIALIVVGLVTYERTKYRKAFRQRKLAEAGAGMGYGGMAERT